MSSGSQLSLFDVPTVCVEPGAGVIVGDGPWGRSWLKHDAVISPANPLYFTCHFCGQTVGSYEFGVPAHKRGCSHPEARNA